MTRLIWTLLGLLGLSLTINVLALGRLAEIQSQPPPSPLRPASRSTPAPAPSPAQAPLPPPPAPSSPLPPKAPAAEQADDASDQTDVILGRLAALSEEMKGADSWGWALALIDQTADQLRLTGEERWRFLDMSRTIAVEVLDAYREYRVMIEASSRESRPAIRREMTRGADQRFRARINLAADRLRTSLDGSKKRNEGFCLELGRWFDLMARP